MLAFFSEPVAVHAAAGPERGTPSNLVGFQGSAETEYAMIVEKKTQQLILYAYADGGFSEMMRVPCSTGKADGRKDRAGDSRTPEGIYFFVKEHQERDLAPIYGAMAFPIDYPNLMDRRTGRGGNSIWLHGTNKPMKARDSNGCIVLENKDIEELSRFITLNRTPMIIVDEIQYAESGRSQQDMAGVLAALTAWNKSLAEGSYHDFLHYYDDSYLPDISWWPQWNGAREDAKGSLKGLVTFEHVAVFQHENVFVSIFDQMLRGNGMTVPLGVKKLFLKNNNGEFRIVGDTFQKIYGGSAGLENPDEDYPLIAGLRRLAEKPPDPQEDIARMVDEWIAAWSSKDIQRYGGYYASSFESRGMNRTQWLAYKDELNRKYRSISIKKSQLRIQVDPDMPVVSFVQTYESSGYKAVGVKQLVLKHEDNQWKIYRETWQSL